MRRQRAPCYVDHFFLANEQSLQLGMSSSYVCTMPNDSFVVPEGAKWTDVSHFLMLREHVPWTSYGFVPVSDRQGAFRLLSERFRPLCHVSRFETETVQGVEYERFTPLKCDVAAFINVTQLTMVGFFRGHSIPMHLVVWMYARSSSSQIPAIVRLRENGLYDPLFDRCSTAARPLLHTRIRIRSQKKRPVAGGDARRGSSQCRRLRLHACHARATPVQAPTSYDARRTRRGRGRRERGSLIHETKQAYDQRHINIARSSVDVAARQYHVPHNVGLKVVGKSRARRIRLRRRITLAPQRHDVGVVDRAHKRHSTAYTCVQRLVTRSKHVVRSVAPQR